MGWNCKHLYAYRISANEFLHEQVPAIVQVTLTCTSRRGEPGHLDCAVDSVDHIQMEFSFFLKWIFSRGWTKAVFWFVNFWCFVIVWFPIVRSELVNLSWFVMSLAGVGHLPI